MYPTETHPGSGTFIADQVESLRKVGEEVELLFVDRPHAGRHVYRELRETARNVAEKGKPDLVHVMYGGVMADVVTRAIRNRPVLISFCGDDLLGSRDSGVLKSLSARYGVLASCRAAARAAGIVVKSHVLFDALPRRINTSRIWILPNGVDFSRFHPKDRGECQSALGWDSTRSHVLFPAPPLRREKRFALAQAGVELLNQAGADVELHVLQDVPHDDVPAWLNAASAVLLTSSHEGSPNAVKEALACNVPVVSVDVGDVRERIALIEGCFIAEPTPEDIAAKLGRVLERRERIDARDSMKELSLERVAEKLKGIYRTLANGH
jgi:teichuronic acid biosynthesis glycosyltransferase TuaC